MIDEAKVRTGLPAWRRIAAIVAAELRAGRWRPGERLPSASALALRFGVHRHTARRSLAWLREQGLLEQSALPRAASAQLPVPVAASADLFAHLAQLGLAADCDGWRSEQVGAIPPAMRRLAPLGGLYGPLLHVSYDVRLEGTAVARSQAWFPQGRRARRPWVVESGWALAQVLQCGGVARVARRHAWIEAAGTSGRSGPFPGCPVLRLCVLALDAEGHPLKVCWHRFDADRIRLLL